MVNLEDDLKHGESFPLTVLIVTIYIYIYIICHLGDVITKIKVVAGGWNNFSAIGSHSYFKVHLTIVQMHTAMCYMFANINT